MDKSGGKLNMKDPKLARNIFLGYAREYPTNLFRWIICLLFRKIQWPFEVPGDLKVRVYGMDVAQIKSVSCSGLVVVEPLHPRFFSFQFGKDKEKLKIRRIPCSKS
jgi:hypothetical protein